MYLRAVKYVEGDQYEFKNLDALPWQLISVNKKTQTVGNLEHILSELYDIPVERLVVILRHENILSLQTVRSEHYNIAWRQSKTIEEASKLDHGTILFVEDRKSVV